MSDDDWRKLELMYTYLEYASSNIGQDLQQDDYEEWFAGGDNASNDVKENSMTGMQKYWKKVREEAREEGRKEAREEGAENEVRVLLIEGLTDKFGDLGGALLTKVNEINELKVLHELARALFCAVSFNEYEQTFNKIVAKV